MHSFNKYLPPPRSGRPHGKDPSPLHPWKAASLPLSKTLLSTPCGSCSVKEQRMEFICFEASPSPSRLPATQGFFILPPRLPLGGLPYQGYAMGQMTSETGIPSPNCRPRSLKRWDLVMCFHGLSQRPLEEHIRAIPTSQSTGGGQS